MAASPDRVCIVDVGDDDVGDLAPGTNETPGAKLTTLQWLYNRSSVRRYVQTVATALDSRTTDQELPPHTAATRLA
jgi:hypothetical protein